MTEKRKKFLQKKLKDVDTTRLKRLLDSKKEIAVFRRYETRRVDPKPLDGTFNLLDSTFVPLKLLFDIGYKDKNFITKDYEVLKEEIDEIYKTRQKRKDKT